jgi:hypothetical protein
VLAANIEQPLDSDLSFSDLADTAPGALAFLVRSGDALRWLSRANVWCRVLLGRQLQVIQEQRLWESMDRPIGDGESEAGARYHGWDDFMSHGFPAISGLRKQTGYAALKLAQAAVFRNMSEPELGKFESLGNAFELVKLERKGVRITEELIVAAQTLTVEAFRQMTGSGKKATVEVVVDGSDTARRLQWIANILKMADPDSLLAFQEVLQNAMLQADGNPTDAVDCINAACIHQWQQEGLPELEAVRP